MAHVNLWELITRLASPKEDTPNGDKCRAILAAQAQRPSFGSELSLDVDEFGTWTVEMFDHEEQGIRVKLSVQSTGRLVVTRSRMLDDAYETRTITF